MNNGITVFLNHVSVTCAYGAKFKTQHRQTKFILNLIVLSSLLQ